jgi:hypothetical protein
LIVSNQIATDIFAKFNIDLSNPFFWLANKAEDLIKKKIKSKTTENKISRRDYLNIMFESLAESVNAENDKTSDASSVEKKLNIDVICNLNQHLFQ